MRLQKVTCVLGQLLLMAALAHVALAQNGSLNGFDDYVRKAMKEWEVPGVAIDGMRAQVALIPEEKLGLVVLTNLNGSALPVALMYRIFDSFLGATPRDWSAELLKTTKSLEDQGKAAEKKQDSERTTGTKPSVPLDKYAGTYRNDLYGDVKVTNNDAKLNFRFGPAFTSDLEHWHYDTFRARFFAAGDSKIFVTFALNAQGKVDTLVLGMPGMADYPFKRVPEK